MKLTKIFACLSCCVALCVPSAFAVDEDWVTPVINFTEVTTGRNNINIYGTRTNYSLDADDNAHFEGSSSANVNYPFLSSSIPLTISSSGGSWQAVDLSQNTEHLPYNHYESDQTTYYRDFSYSMMTMDTGGAWFYSDFYLEPGFYEVDTSFYAEIGLRGLSGSSFYYRPVIFEFGFENNGNMVKVQRSYSSSARAYFEITTRSRMYIAVTTSALTDSYTVSIPNQSPFAILYRVHRPTLKYRSIDAVELAALEEANTNAGNTINDHTQVEQEWTGSMVDNFNALHLDGFTFGDGLISGFGLVSDLFMRIWSSLGNYAVVYTFPLYLGVVLLLVGRISKFSGSQGSSNKRGDGDA